MRSEFSISGKRRLCDSVCIYGKYYRVSTLIEKNPMLLWNAIHPKKYIRESGSTENKDVYKPVSLVRTAYDMLKKAVAKVAPREVATVEAQFEYNNKLRKYNKTVKLLKQQLETGQIAINGRRFKKIN